MTELSLQPARERDVADLPVVLFDPRMGDVEDDASSPKQKSLLAIAGTLLAEISLAKLLFAWTISLLLPAVLLGVAPLVATAWLGKVSRHILQLTEIGAALVLVIAATLGWLGWRPLFRIAEVNFWSLNALVVQPGYAFCREALRHLMERIFGRDLIARRADAAARGELCRRGHSLVRVRSADSHSCLAGHALDGLRNGPRVAAPPGRSHLANAVVLISGYLAVAALVWGFADATMDQPIDLAAFDTAPGNRTWRVAHLSDIHLVAEQYGFRIESGRSGPRGNSRLPQIMTCIEAIHNVRPSM